MPKIKIKIFVPKTEVLTKEKKRRRQYNFCVKLVFLPDLKKKNNEEERKNSAKIWTFLPPKMVFLLDLKARINRSK